MTYLLDCLKWGVSSLPLFVVVVQDVTVFELAELEKFQVGTRSETSEKGIACAEGDGVYHDAEFIYESFAHQADTQIVAAENSDVFPGLFF